MRCANGETAFPRGVNFAPVLLARTARACVTRTLAVGIVVGTATVSSRVGATAGDGLADTERIAFTAVSTPDAPGIAALTRPPMIFPSLIFFTNEKRPGSPA